MTSKFYGVILGILLCAYAAGLNLFNVFVCGPILATLMLYLHLFKVTKFPHVLAKGKAVFITGCDTGFGNMLASELANKGFLVFAGCLNPTKELEKNFKDSVTDTTTTGKITILECDVTKDESVQNCVEAVKVNLGENELWAIVNNAGIALLTFVEWMSIQSFQKHYDINTLGVVRVCKAFLPLLRGGKNRRIINVTSIAAKATSPMFSAYSMSKYALRAFSQSLRSEVHRFGIKVITVEPGMYQTNITNTDNVVDWNKQSWSRASEDVKSSYNEMFLNAVLQAIFDMARKARGDLTEVLNSLTNAVMCENPDLEYTPHWTTKLKLTILHLLPQAVEIWFLKKTNPLHRIEEDYLNCKPV